MASISTIMPGKAKQGSGAGVMAGPSPGPRAGEGRDVSSNVSDKGGFVNAAIVGVKGHELDDVRQTAPKFSQHRIDVADHHLRLRREVVGAQRVASRRFVHLTAHKDQLAHAYAVLEGKVLIPVPVALGPSVAAFLTWQCPQVAMLDEVCSMAHAAG